MWLFGGSNRSTPAKNPASAAAAAAAASSTERDPVNVCLRIRPLFPSDSSNGRDAPVSCMRVVDDRTIDFMPKGDSAEDEQAAAGPVLRSSFSRVFDDHATQTHVFSSTTLPLVKDVLDGRNALLFTYGVTGSGKTFTMEGKPTDGGILPRTLDILFNSIQAVKAKRFTFAPTSSNQMVVQTAAKARSERRRARSEPRVDAGRPPPAAAAGTAAHSMSLLDESAFDADGTLADGNVSFDERAIPVDPDSRYSIFLSYAEFYNDNCYDLLDAKLQTQAWSSTPKSKADKRQTKQLGGPDAKGNMFIRNLTEVEVQSTQEALQVLMRGRRYRQVAATDLNDASSRSHSVFNIKVVRCPLDEDGEDVLRDKKCPPHVSQFAMVDLAGSERTSRTNNTGTRLRETGSINRSLMTLGACIEALLKNQTSAKKERVPYRDNPLTLLFKNYFDGHGKVLMLVCVSPSLADADETTHVLRFSAITQQVSTVVSQVPDAPKGLTPGRGIANRMIKEARRKRLGARGYDYEDEDEDEDEESDAYESATSMQEDDAGSRSSAPANAASTQLTAFYQENIQRLESMRDQLRRREREFRAKLEAQVRKSKAQEDRIAALKEALENGDIEISSNQEKLLSAQSENQDALKRLEEELHQAQEKNDVVSAEISEHAAKRSELEEQLRTFESVYQEHVHRSESLKEELDERQALLAHQRESVKEIAKVRKQLEVQLEENKRLAMAALRRQEELWNDKIKTAERHVGEKQEETEQARAEKEALKKKMQSLQEILGEDPELESDVGAAAAPQTRAQRRKERRAAAAAAKPPKSPKSPGKQRRNKILDHRPADMEAPDTVMTPVLKGKTKTVTTPKMGELRSKNTYYLHTQEDANEHLLYKGEVQKSASKSGIAVRFTGLEELTNVGPLGRGSKKRSSTETDEPNKRRRGASATERASEQEIEGRCQMAYEGNRRGLGPSVEHRKK